MKSCWSVAVVTFFIAGGAAQAQGFTQAYLTVDGKQAATNDKSLWSYIPQSGEVGGYYICTFEARDGQSKVVRRDVVIYFNNPPQGNDTDKCNWWVYWARRSDQKPGQLALWGRCPTPKHPDYDNLTKNLGGVDLWQLIPPGQRKTTDKPRVKDVKDSFGKTINAMKEGKPKVSGAEGAPVIQCIDFKNPIFG